MTTSEIYTILKGWIQNSSVLGSSVHVIRGEQSAPKPAKEYMVIHQPMTVQEYASGNETKADTDGNIDYTKHYQATISLEEVGFTDNGDKLRTLKNSLRMQDIKDYFRNSKVSILRTETITPIPAITENIWELRTTMDLIILFPDEGTYTPGYIETVEFEGVYNN
jgi:hypothetical protein